MDSFMDKIAQKFTAQDMIKANSAAEEKEMKRLRMQVAEYDQRLQEMRKLNLKNLELADQLQAMMEQGKKKIKEIQVSAGQEDSAELDELKKELLNTQNAGMQNVCEVLENQNQEIKNLQEILNAQNTRMNELSEQVMDHVHKEDVKVYRNVQAAVAEENKALLAELSKKTSTHKPVIILSAMTLLASLVNVGFWVAWLLGVF